MSRPSWVSDLVLGVVLPVAIVAAGIFGFIALGEAKPEQKEAAGDDIASRLAALPEAEVARIQAFDTSKQTLDIELQGNVVPFRELMIGAEVTGRVVYKDPNCRQGRYVTKGQVLFRIDPQDYELEMQRLAKMREQDYASLRELDQEEANIQKSLDVAIDELKLHDAELLRLTQLREGIVSDTELDAARRARLASLNQQVSIQNQLDLAKKRRARLEAAEKLAETQLRKAQLDLSRCEIISPVDGVIVRDMVENDSFIQRGSTLATIEDTGNVEVSCSLRMDQLYWVLNQKGEHDMPAVATDDPNAMAGRYALPPTPVTVEFQVTGRENQVYAWEGVLNRYEGSGIDPQSRTVPCRVRVEKPYQYMVDGKVKSDDNVSGPPALVRGMFVNLKVHTRPQSELMLVPKMAVKPGNVVWRFEMTDEVVKSTSAGKTTPASEVVATAKPKDNAPAPAAETPGLAKNKADKVEDDFRAEDWAPGRMLVLQDLQVIRPYTLTSSEEGKSVDYWVCEVIPNTLKSGDWVVVTPMAAVKGDGTDAVRVYSRSVTGQPQPAVPEPSASQPAESTAGKLDVKDAS
jgi:multidrug efflux pump subunit AcrA (membrane-fusion protein)